jgi:glycosyltransferase involved in cell wall biosynthesis
MKVLHYVYDFSLPSETFIYDYILNLEVNGVENYILCHKRHLNNKRPFKRVKIISDQVSLFNKIYFKIFDNWAIRNQTEVIKYISELKPDIVHAHFGPNGLKLKRLLKKFEIKIPLVVSMHGTDTTMYPLKYKQYKKNIQQITKDSTTIFTVPSIFLKEEFQRNFSLNISDGLRVLPNSYSANIVNKKFKYYKENDKLKLISIGRLIYWKGFNFLVEAADILNKKSIDFELVIIGEGQDRNNIEKLIIEKKLIGKVILLGLRHHDEVLNMLSKSDIYIQPSIVDLKTNQTESFGVAVLEAIIVGLPVIVTNVGGLPDTVLGGNSGFARIIESKDPKAIVNSVLSMMKNCNDNTSFREKVQESYSQTSQFENSMQIYDELLLRAL